MRTLILSIVSALLSATPSLAADCAQARTTIEAMRLGATLVVPAETPHVGQPLRIVWTQPGQTGRVPAYLIVAIDKPARFAGLGLYGLTPAAQAPFGFQRLAGQTRAVIPLYGDGSSKTGFLDLTVLAPGESTLSWDLVAFDGCGENAASGSERRVSLKVMPGGQPSLIIGDPFKSTDATSRFVSKDGARIIEREGGHYRVIDAVTGAEIAERAGIDPRFSPTGRFVGAQEQDGFVVLDAIDGISVATLQRVGDIAWDNADSFVVAGGPQAGEISAVNTLNSSAPTYGGDWLAARCCSGVDNAAYRLDLENNLAAFSGPLGVIVESLTSGGVRFQETMKIRGEIAGDRKAAVRFGQKVSAVRPFALPKVWESRGGLVFSHLGLPALQEQTPVQKALARFLTAPKPADLRRLTSAKSASAPSSIINRSAWSGPNSTTESNEVTVDRYSKRLEEFGFTFLTVDLPTQTVGKFVAGYEKELPKAEALRVTTLIGTEFRGARDRFQYVETDGSNCEASTPEGLNSNINVARRWSLSAGRVVWLTWLGCTQGNAAFNAPNLYIFDSARKIAERFIRENHSSYLNNEASGAAPSCDYTIDSCLANAELQGGRYVVLTTHEGQGFAVYDLEAQKLLAKRFGLSRGPLLSRIRLMSDTRHAIQINADGTFFAYRTEDGAQVLAGRVVDDEVVVALPDGRFDATMEGGEMVRLRFPGLLGEHVLAQFTSKLHVNDLVSLAMSGKPIPSAAAVGTPPHLSATISRESGSSIKIIALSEGAAPATSVRVYQDGVLTGEHPYPKAGPLSLSIEPLRGARWITLLAVDADGVVSAPVGQDLGGVASGTRNVRVIAAGVNRYEDPKIQQLEMPRRDAQAFVGALKGADSSLTATSAVLLLDQEASPSRIKEALSAEIDAASSGETVMLFFAGHGVRDENGRLYLATSGTRLDNIPGTALRWDDLAPVLSRAKGRVAVFLDTCHSGAAGTGFFATNDATAGALLATMRSNIVIFSASKGRELALETAEGGMFTRALVEVIGGDRSAYDLNRNGVIELSELYRGVKSKVRTKSNGQQTPWFARNQMIGDFALF